MDLRKRTAAPVRTPVSAALAILCLLATLGQALDPNLPPSGLFHPEPAWPPWASASALGWPEVCNGEWWRLLSYCAAHQNLLHGLAAALGLLALGRSVEPLIGAFQLVGVVFSGTLFGAISHGAGSFLANQSPPSNVCGALPAVFALTGVYCSILPHWRLGAASLWLRKWPLQAILPHFPKVRAVGWLSVSVTAIWWASGWFPEAGPDAMLGALIFGWAYTRTLGFGGLPVRLPALELQSLQEKRLEEMNWADFVAKELNPVLEKISKHGLRSLTKLERRILRYSRNKLDERS